MDKTQAEHWEERYRSDNIPWDTGEPEPELVRFIEEEGIQPGRLIELGCGTGSNSLWLAQQGFDVTAVDIAETALAVAESRVTTESVRYVQGDVCDFSWDGEAFPWFFDRGCYHVVRRTHVAEYVQTLDRLTTADARGLILTGNAREAHQPGPPVVSEEQLRTELGAVFDFLWLREFRFGAKKGSGDNFLGWSCFLRKKPR